MAITFTPIAVNEHDNGARLGAFENDIDPNGSYYHYHNDMPAHFKLVGNELFLEDGWHFNYEDLKFYNHNTGYYVGPYIMDQLDPDFNLQIPIKDVVDFNGMSWTYAIPEFVDIDESIEITPVPFSSLETGATIATISTNLPVNEKFSITQNTFVTVDGNNIKLNDNFYYDIESGAFQSGGSTYDPNASTGQIVISAVQVDSQTASETINYKQEFDYSTFLVSIVSQAQQASSSLTFTPVSANEHENGALLGNLQTSGESGGVYSFNSSKPSMLKIVGDQLFLEENYHFDYETSSFYHYTQESNGGTSWSYLGPYSPEELSWRLKYTAPSGAEQFVDVNLSFSDIDEAVTITPVAFNSLEVGTIVATVSHNFLTNSQIELGSNSLLEIEGSNIKITDQYHYNVETSKFHSGDSYFDPNLATGELSLISKQTGTENINYYEGLNYSTFLQSVVSLAQHTPLAYYSTRSTETKQKAGTNSIDALLYDDVQVHKTDSYYANILTDLADDTTVITYSFSALNGTTAQYVSGYDEGIAQVTGLNVDQQESVQKALTEWEKVANIKFHEVEETGDVVGTMRFAFTDFSDSDTQGFWGWARSPNENANSGDIWISSENLSEEDWQPGSSYNFMSLMHEIGHSLGLAHPFAEEGSGSTDILPTSEDFRNYTIMSYTNPENYYTYSDANQYQYLISSTPMVYDIAAIQHLYGSAENNTGDTIFSYTPDQPFVEAIWDSSGNDTLDLSNFVEACAISLVPGAYSTIVCTDWSMINNLGIAHGTVIENANGGEGSDTIIGNDSNNSLDGGGGNDVLTGGAGLDSFRFSSNFGSDTVTDFSLAQDNLTFFDASGVEIDTSSLTESNNDAGDVVLTTADGSNVTLQGVTAYGSYTPSLNGTVKSKSGTVLENVLIKGFNSNGDEVASTTSDVSGQFGFNAVEDIILTLEKNFTNDSTVTVRDALDALKLSIGMTKSDGTIDPLDFIAADMNQDGKVSVRDALDILKYSLNMESSQAHWKFVPDDLDTSNLSRSSVTYDNSLSVSLSEIQSDHNFLGILVGDVNGTI